MVNKVYIAYKTPVTQVICKGHGSVPCYEGYLPWNVRVYWRSKEK